MESFKLSNISVGGPYDRIFVIAEIGQNHQGSLTIAKEMIREAKTAGCNCVKFQKSCLSAKFTRAALNRPYINQNSWGATYEEHKKFLEFTIAEMKELKDFADQQNILFSASAMDEVSLNELLTLDLPFIKIGSGDTNNFKLLELAARHDVPLVISTGMQMMETVEKVVEIMKTYKKKNFSLLHCVSAYPTKPEDACLKLILKLKATFPDIVIGYSGHENGIILTQASVLLGAKIIERHFTLDKRQKGSDHKCSLTPLEFTDLIKFIRKTENREYTEKTIDILSILKPSQKEKVDLEMALKPVEKKIILPCELECRRKLGKSLVYDKNLSKGHHIQKDDLTVKVSEPFGISAEKIKNYFGAILNKNVFCDMQVSDNDFCR